MKLAAVNRKLGRIETAIDRSIKKGELPGAVLRAKKGELEYNFAFGSAVLSPQRLEVRANTIYDVASLTKVMATASALMLLISDGKVSLDQPVAEHLPPFGERDKDRITVRHLLTHSAGLRPWKAFYEELRDKERKKGEVLCGTPQGKEAILHKIYRSALVHDPGEAAVYGDLDFIVLGELVEVLAGEALDSFCDRRIYQPLGMTDTHFNRLPFESDASRYAATEQCSWRDKILWGEVHDPNAWAMGGVAGHAGLFSTADDVMKFAQEVLAADRGESGIFDATLAQEFFRRQDLQPDSDWALGWDTPTPGQSTSGQYFSPRSIGHTGFTGTSIWIDLDTTMTVVLLTNRVHLLAKKSRFDLRPEIHDIIAEAFSEA